MLDRSSVKINMKTYEFKNNVSVNANGETRKIAFAKDINRCVNSDNVKAIFENMKIKGYKGAELIQVIPAEVALRNEGNISLVSLTGETIPLESTHEYFLVLDGQHRVCATALYNQHLEMQGIEETVVIPAVMVELKENETIAEYINEINITKRQWRIDDYVRGAAHAYAENELLQRYNTLLKRDNNKNGYPLSTLNLIYCSDAKALSMSDFSKLCAKTQFKGRGGKTPVMPSFNIDRGDKYIALCREKGFSPADIAKRYLIRQFNNIIVEESYEKAMEVFLAITEKDVKEMKNHRGNLDEELVYKQITQIRNRIMQ